MQKGLKESGQGQLHVRVPVAVLKKLSPKGLDILESDCPGSGVEQLCVAEERQQLFKDIEG